MPTTPLPALCISSRTEATSSGFLSIHDLPLGVDAGQVDFDERILRRGAQGVHAVAARAVRSDDLLFLGLHQVFHRALVVVRPAVFCMQCSRTMSI